MKAKVSPFNDMPSTVIPDANALCQFLMSDTQFVLKQKLNFCGEACWNINNTYRLYRFSEKLSDNYDYGPDALHTVFKEKTSCF